MISTRLSKLLALLSLIGTASAVLLPQHHLTAPSGRHSLATGPAITHSTYHTIATADADNALVAFNLASPLQSVPGLLSVSDDEPEERGTMISNAFISHLHPGKIFRVQSAYHSEASNVFHAHYVQVVNGKDIVNALVNVNIDLSNGNVLSYGDSAWRGAQTCTSDYVDNGLPQVVLGGATQESACITSYDTPLPDQVLDPRRSLVSFIAIGNPAAAVSADFDVADITISYPSTSSHSTDLLLHNVPGALEPVKARLAYLQVPSDEHEDREELQLVWSFEYQAIDNWYEAHVSAESNAELAEGKQEAAVLMAVDWQKDYVPLKRDAPAPRLGKPERYWDDEENTLAAPESEPKKDETHDAIYRVWAWSVNDPGEGPRTVVVNPADQIASPMGWHSVPRETKNGGRNALNLASDWQASPGWVNQLRKGAGANFTDTRGNNVFAQNNPSGGNEYEMNYRPNAPNLNFTFPLRWGCQGEECKGKDIPPVSYKDVSITELFFTINMLHDLTFRYGFDEASGNFQERNFHKGHKGLGNDAVIANAQDASGMNNANFATPQDGTPGRMRMYVWDLGGLPLKDGALEEGIVTHEFTHGVSTRLTGGPANSGCLPFGESGGMGEGWGDWLATLVRMHKKKPQDWGMGDWAAGRGIRKYPYSLNHTVNPFTYKDVDKMWEVHAIGAVWAEFLYVLTEFLIKEHGFEHYLFPPLPGHEQHHSFYNTSAVTGKMYPARGNTLALQLILDGMKLQPCRPNFLAARDAILAADHALTGGENYCVITAAFADRGVGPKAAVKFQTPWGGGIREEDFELPSKCKTKKA